LSLFVTHVMNKRVLLQNNNLFVTHKLHVIYEINACCFQKKKLILTMYPPHPSFSNIHRNKIAQ